MTAVDPLSAAVELMGALPVPMGNARSYRSPAPRPEAVDVPLPVLEQQLAELRAHAMKNLAARGQAPTGELLDQWHEFLDIDPDLRGRDYNPQPRRAS